MYASKGGFTLVELLVVIGIIGILAAIAIPHFTEYRERGFDSRALADIRNGAVAEESYYAVNASYVTCATTAVCEATLPQFGASAGTVINFNDAGTSFNGQSTHPLGSGAIYIWDSQNGGLQ